LEESNFSDKVITIVGLGVIGGAFAMALRELKPKGLYGVDLKTETLKKAESMGIIDQGYLDPQEILKRSDLVVICIYPKLIVDFVRKNKHNFKPGAVITDTSGVKNALTKEIIKILPDNVDFIFGHPMAGREKRGLEYASREAFKGANYIITPLERNKEENIKLIENLVKRIGFKRVSRLSPERHDEIIAYTSQLPHALAVALINSEAFTQEVGAFIGDSYRDLTRIAQINDELWSELFFTNRDNLVKQIEMFEQKLGAIKKAVLNLDKEMLVENFKEASRRRSEL
jgi:prephenate dehydrogenase